MKVEEFRSGGTVHIPMTCTLQEAARQMRDQHVGALIVTDDGQGEGVVGIVTDRDIVIHAVVRDTAPRDVLVGDIMTAGVLSVDEKADIADALQAMASHGLRRLAVTSADGAVVGVLSLDDVLDALGREWAMLASVLRGERSRERTASVQSPLPSL
ncbi:CBS domain-containing protein [Trinickia caryophylli]|uniref:CBS domain-containing protein n=1 Tax=Trinickia caryophylli TaxID=28094 RepID=A0A1X7GFK1_TRICW|nr:CBS domain-containing protein [Trinickia caryophylli]PMS10845.1 CBS domain-containing protein [Trinickia caryophylli]TRX13890.1 CBS domain-containing protein [Trinickia caryophylli]WQE15480.1 CBS domain-containing protein [Trinickia caryophylli]SMF69062.1 CBS domain-containing protein [Trinickia caryophylli]GLU33776.1 CBS domain-containing protein [Trinickia caryophylli]